MISLRHSFSNSSTSSSAVAAAHAAATLRAAAIDMRERAVAAREESAAARERALAARALETGVRIFENGDPDTLAAAFAFIKISADGGNNEAKVRLGEMLYNGQGSERDAAAALRLFREAADAGNSQGLFSCGAMEYAALHAAHDSPSMHDLSGAIHDLRAAADLGHAAAQGFLAAMSAALPPASSACAAIAQDCTVFVVTGGWHSGLCFQRHHLPPSIMPETLHFPSAHMFEIGWGDAVFYPARESTAVGMLTAMLPGPAVIHMAGIQGHPAREYPGAVVTALRLQEEQLQRLVAHVAASFKRQRDADLEASDQLWDESDGDAIKPCRIVARGLYPYSLFYPAHGSFHLLNTCNSWTARGLEHAGLIQADGVQTADELLARLKFLKECC